MSGTKKKKDEKATGIGGQIAAFLFLAAAGYWQYYNLTHQAKDLYILLAGTAVLIMSFIFMGCLNNHVLVMLYEALFLVLGSYWVYYNLHHPVSLWVMAFSWTAGVIWAALSYVSVGLAPGIDQNFFQRLLVTVFLWGGIIFYLWAYCHVIPYFSTAFQNVLGEKGVLGAVMTGGQAFVALAAGIVGFYWLTYSVPDYFACYFQAGRGPKITVTKGESYRVPLNYARAERLANTCEISKEKNRRVVGYYTALCMHCADLKYELFQKVKGATPSSDVGKKLAYQKRYRSNDQPKRAEKETIHGWQTWVYTKDMTQSYRMLEQLGEISKARDYLEKRLEIILAGFDSVGTKWFEEILKDRKRLDDGRPVDPAVEKRLQEELRQRKERDVKYEEDYRRRQLEEEEEREERRKAWLEQEKQRHMAEEDDDEEEYTWNGSSKGSASQDSSSSDPWARHKAEHDLSRMPNIIYDSSNNRWQKSWGSGDHATYHNDQGQEVTIYSGQISGSSAQTSAGHFHWY